MIQWRLPQYKKHKTWDGDAVLVLRGSSGTLYDLEGKIMGSGSVHATYVEEGGEYKFSDKEIGIDHSISRGDYFSGKCFGRGMSSSTPSRASSSSKPIKQFVTPRLTKNILSAKPMVPTERKAPAVDLQPVDLLSKPGSSGKASKADVGSGSCWTANWRKPQAKKHKTWDGDAFVKHTGDTLMVISEKGKVLGRKEWNGVPLYSGFMFRASGKEVELDAQVSSSQLPNISGVNEEAEEDDVSAPACPPYLLQVKQSLREVSSSPPSAGASKPFVTPTHDPKAEGAIVMRVPSEQQSQKYNKKSATVIPVVLDPIIARHLREHQIEGVRFLYECVMGLRRHEGQGCILADEMQVFGLGLGKTLQTIALVWTLLKQNPYGGGPTLSKVLIVCPVSLVNNWRAEFHKWLGRDRVGIFTGDKDKAKIKHFVNSKIHHVLIIGYEKLRTVIDDLAYCSPPIGLIVCDEGHRLKSSSNKTSTMFKSLRTPRRIILSGTPIQNDLSEFHAMADFCNPGLLDDYPTFRRIYETPILKSRAPDATVKETQIGNARSTQLADVAKSFVLRREATLLKKFLPPKREFPHSFPCLYLIKLENTDEYVVFITPTKLQLSIFAAILNPRNLDDLMQSSTAESLALINMLTKISNSPILLKAQADKAKASNAAVIHRRGMEEALALLPDRAEIEDFSLSGKLTALAKLLKIIRKETEEKCIIVSHYTSTLNIIEAYCKAKSYTYFRLDGQTPAQKRQEYVNIFNKSSQQSHFLFLLSSKAGGVGLNLIGASRLCLIDSDWNPSHDLQSMARIHRDGQKRPVFIYRFLTAGAIDEKIYQRQVTKIGLSNSLMGSGTGTSKSDSFTKKDLRDIFRVHPDTGCNTHDLLGCPCEESEPSILGDIQSTINTSLKEDLDSSSDSDESLTGFISASQVKPHQADKLDQAYLNKKKAELAALGEWTHINCLRPRMKEDILDDVLHGLLYQVKESNDQSVPAAQPNSRLDSLLSAVQLDNLGAMDNLQIPVRDVPGGTISFLFEKTTKSQMEDVEPKQE
ncbi:hypothetical protein CONPUDRAFT_101343 [Coniophora puteana RWD-64-598 SS2]|uniref:DNA repair and recombination protein RAD54B n=1 Tax=Coniophora puteana (strain RWD-64-598) TaxID=741705 RepID=A0A5M3MV23_CONPW|nr:uncharacterized protein CONPUDRAFT_101343 [Coniophora puteana RWD-64-598 SS2]EIW82890.1 hypothetical protein CONPUDRAFT_101343 [Coniophora puteana RWD-64-598 SS2]